MKAWQRALALLGILVGLHGLLFLVAFINHGQDVYENQEFFGNAALAAFIVSILLLPLLLTIAVLPRRPLAARLAAGDGLRARLAGAGYLLASLVPGLLLVFGTVFWAAPHHYPLAAGYAMVLALAAWTFIDDTRRLFPSIFKPARAAYLSLLAIAGVLLIVDGDHLPGLRPTKAELARQEKAQARRNREPQGLADSQISELLSTADGTLVANASGWWFRSTDQGVQWALVFPDQKAISIVKLPQSDALAAAVAGQGVLRSDDSGRTWQTLRPIGKDEEAGGLWMSANGTLYFYAAGNIVSSNDEGRTWSKPGIFRDSEGNELSPSINTFAAGADCAAYAISTEDGMFRSRDCGLTWKAFTAPDTIDDLLVAGDGKLLAVFNTKGIMRSIDHGAHWQAASVEPDDDFAVSKFLPAAGLPLHAAVDGQMLRSADNGIHWAPTEDRFPEPVLSMALAKDGNWLAGTSSGLYRSRDQGLSWSKAPAPPQRQEEPEPRRPWLLGILGV